MHVEGLSLRFRFVILKYTGFPLTDETAVAILSCKLNLLLPAVMAIKLLVTGTCGDFEAWFADKPCLK